jgi:endonuclease/exonuclease/phosphatase (EEP) superfamily protein YafD
MIRFVTAAVVLLTAVALAILAWPQLFGLATTTPAAQIVALRGLGVAVALVGMVGLALLAAIARPARRFLASIAVLLLAFAAVNAAVLATRGVGNLGFEIEGENDVTVLSWNTLGDAPGATVIAALALETDADIVSLPETTNELGVEIALAMQAAGRPMWVHTVAYDQVSKANSTTLLISVDLGEYTVDESVQTTAELPTVLARPDDGTGPVILAVHALAPIPPMVPGWQQDLLNLAEACRGDNVILAGDFNATLDHFGGLGSTPEAALGNCLDAAQVTDNAAVGTWPTALPALVGAPIDHVMATPNWRVTGMRVIQSHDGYGTDHRPVVAQLSPAG